jgi:hypothetical protein
LTPIETILTILKKLEYLEGLVKLAHRCKNEEHKATIVAIVALTYKLYIGSISTKVIGAKFYIY